MRIPPKALELLTVLVRGAGRMVSKDELLAEVWPGTFVEEVNLTVHMSTLRRALGEDPAQVYIETVPKHGYRFIAPVRECTAATTAPQSLPLRRFPWRSAASAAALLLLAAAFVVSRRSAHAPAAVSSLAVLPFQAPDVEEQEKYLGLGLADAVTTQLAGVRQLNVRPTEAVRFAPPGADPVSAGQKLKVDHVLSGLVQRAGDRVRLTVQLVDVRTGRTRWSARFDDRFTDLFALQDAVSQKVALALVDRLSTDDKARLLARRPASGEAYREYLQGRFFLNQATRPGSERSIRHFTRAIELDGRYALAYAGVARAYQRLGTGAIRGMSPHEAMPLARQWAEKALAIDDGLSEAHAVLGAVKFGYDWDWSGAEASYRRALALSPSEATPHHGYGWFLGARGRHEEAIRELTRARELDPVSVLIAENLGVVLGLAGHSDEALRVLQEATAIDPSLGRPHSRQVAVYEQLRRFDEAFGAWHKALVVSNRLAEADELKRAYAAGGYHGAAAFAARYGVAHQDPFQATLGYLFLGDRERTLEQLEICYQQRHTWLPFLAVDPRFKPLRGDPRFQDLLRRLRLS